MKFFFSTFNGFNLFFLFLFSGCTAQSQKSNPSIKIIKISELKSTKSYVSSNILLLDGTLHPPKSVWNHINNELEEWEGLKKERNAYAISAESVENILDTTTFATFDAVLVKKYADWHHQHANGFVLAPSKTSYLQPDKDFLVVEMFLDITKSSIAKKAELFETYLLTKNQQKEWDRGLANLGLQFFFDNKITASFVLAIPSNYYNKWIRIEIPLQDFRFLDANKNTFFSTEPMQIAALNLTAETNNGLVYRNYTKELFTTTSFNLFKELAVKLKRVFVVTN